MFYQSKSGLPHHHLHSLIHTPRFLAGLFGVGGGAVTVPALTLSLGVSHYQVYIYI